MNSHSLRPPMDASARKRRKSVVDETALLTGRVQRTVDTLVELWDEINLPETDRTARVATVYDEVYSLLDEMVAQEQAMVANVYAKKEEHLSKLSQLCDALGLPPYQPTSTALYALVAELREQNDTLEQRVLQRRNEASDLCARDEKLASRLHVAPFYVPRDSLPTEATLVQLRNHIENLELLLQERQEAVQSGAEELHQLLRKLRRAAKTDFERMVLAPHAAQHDFDLSHENMAALEGLLHEVRSEFEAHMAELRRLVEEEWADLERWYEKCGVPQNERFVKDLSVVPDHCSTTLHTNVHTDAAVCESLAQQLNAESAKWRAVYERKRAVYDALESWMNLWGEKLELDDKVQHDGTLRANRGGCLDRALKHQKRLELRSLPDARNNLAGALQAYMQRHPNEPFDVHGCSDPLEYVDNLVEQHRLQHSMNAKIKASERKKKTVHEVRWGTTNTKSSVPSRSPAKTPKRQPPAGAPQQQAKRPAVVTSAPQQQVAKRHCGAEPPALAATPSKHGATTHHVGAGGTPNAGERVHVRRAALAHTQFQHAHATRQEVANFGPDTPPESRTGGRLPAAQTAAQQVSPPDYEKFHTELETRNGDHQSTSIEDGHDLPAPPPRSHLATPTRYARANYHTRHMLDD